MALSVATLKAARDELVLALARGVLSVRDANGEEVTYATPGAMQRAIAALEARISSMQQGAPSRYLVSTSKGT